MSKDLKQMYKTIMDDHFTPQMEVSFVDGDTRQTLFYEKVKPMKRSMFSLLLGRSILL